MDQFYTYVHCKPDLTPFYVGKGRRSRAIQLTSRRNIHHQRIVKKYGVRNIIIEMMPCRSEAEALFRECLAIKALRAAGIVLANMTPGGEKPSGYTRGPSPKKGIAMSPEQKAKLSAAHKGKVLTESHKAAISKATKGKPRSPETKKRMSAAAYRLWADETVRNNRVTAYRAARATPISEASRQRMRDGQKRRREQKRNSQ